MTITAVPDANTSAGWGNIFGTIKDVAGNYFNYRLNDKALGANANRTATQTTYAAGEPWTAPQQVKRSPPNYQEWGIALAIIGVVVGIVSLLVRK